MPWTTPVLAPIPGLTVANGLELALRTQPAIGSQTATKGCECPKPKKKDETKKREERCTNPLISRTNDGTTITTVRKVQCQQSKSKLPSPPVE